MSTSPTCRPAVGYKPSNRQDPNPQDDYGRTVELRAEIRSGRKACGFYGIKKDRLSGLTSGRDREGIPTGRVGGRNEKPSRRGRVGRIQGIALILGKSYPNPAQYQDFNAIRISPSHLQGMVTISI